MVGYLARVFCLVTFTKDPFGMVFQEKQKKKKTEAESKEKVRKLKKQTPRRLKKRIYGES